MKVIVEESKIITSLDRCDSGSCGAQAYIKAIGVTGELFFCAHHYNKITNNAVGWHNLEKFAYQIIDERDRLIENRLVGDN
jgi:hypothetical protein